MKRLLFILFTIHCSLFTVHAQVIKNGSHWWDGLRLYTATVNEAGNVRMEGESVSMGGDSFLLNKVQGQEGRYTLESANKYGWLSIRGKLGARVD